MARGKRADGKVNKMEAVREVIRKYGKDVSPIEIVKYARDEHGADMSTDMASNYKSAALKQLGLRSGRRRKRGPRAGWKTAANGAKVVAKTGVRISLDDLAAVKKLVDQIGAEKVEQLARVLAK